MQDYWQRLYSAIKKGSIYLTGSFKLVMTRGESLGKYVDRHPFAGHKGIFHSNKNIIVICQRQRLSQDTEDESVSTLQNDIYINLAKDTSSKIVFN